MSETPPTWAKGMIVAASTAAVGLLVAALWALLGGGFAAYIDGRADKRIESSESTADGSTQAAKISELTQAVTGLTHAIEASETVNQEFRSDVRTRLEALNAAILALAGNG